MRGYLAGRAPRSKGWRCPADASRTEEIVAVMRCCGERPHGLGARGLIVVLWRAGLRIQEALDLAELDLDPRHGSVLGGKGGYRREVGMDESMAVGPLFCVITGRGRPRGRTCAGERHVRARRRFVPHQLRHAHALELAHEVASLNVIQRQLGHRNLDVTAIYLQGIHPNEIIETVHSRRQAMIPASARAAPFRAKRYRRSPYPAYSS